MKTRKFWFTIIELLISIVIIGILTTVLFRAYNSISETTFRVQQEKNIQQEMIWIAQTLQNISDNNSIDFDSYIESIPTDSLFLSGKDGKIKITSQWNCVFDIPEITWFNQEQKDNPCQLIIMNQDWSIIPITTSSESLISKPNFTIFPTKPNNKIIEEDQNPFLKIRQPSFKINFSIYTPLYEKWNWIRTSSILFQQFFNLQK